MTPGSAMVTFDGADRVGLRVRSLHEALNCAEHDDEVKVVVLTGAGRAFSAGYDLAVGAGSPPAGADAWHPLLDADVALTIGFGRCASQRSPRCAAGAWPVDASSRCRAT
jgi:hypothetical protein